MNWFLPAFTLSSLGLSGIAIYYLFKDGRKPYRTLAWLVFILFTPFIGSLVYFSMGMNLRKRKIFDLKKVVDLANYRTYTEQSLPEVEEKVKASGLERHLGIIRLVTRTSLSMLYFHNRVRVLQGGEKTFDAIFKACTQARTCIFMEYYIFEEGEMANRFAEIFEQKLAEGVRVILIYDGLGSSGLARSYIRRLEKMGVEIKPFQPVRFGKLARVNYRNHRKILVVDDSVGFVGGINVDDRYVKGDPKLGPWVDTHLMIEGEAVNYLRATLFSTWLFVSGENMFDKTLEARSVGDTPVQMVNSGPDSDYGSIQFAYLHMINVARNYIYIANSYVVPTESMLKALIAAGLSGKDVRLVVPASSDSLFVKWSMQSYFEDLLEAGVRIFLFKSGFLHSKVLLVDDEVCSIGTANMDIRSFELNFEINAMIYEQETALQVKAIFEDYLANSDELKLQDFRNRARLERLKEAVGRLVSPVM